MTKKGSKKSYTFNLIPAKEEERTMKLRATMIIEFEATDFLDAGKHQEELVELAKKLSKKYDSVTFDIRERRELKVRKTRKKKMVDA